MRSTRLEWHDGWFLEGLAVRTGDLVELQMGGEDRWLPVTIDAENLLAHGDEPAAFVHPVTPGQDEFRWPRLARWPEAAGALLLVQAIARELNVSMLSSSDRLKHRQRALALARQVEEAVERTVIEAEAEEKGGAK